jgi:undecaprenyl diphosphate synthase
MKIDKNKLPRHIAIIMDGNGRWARKRRLPKMLGHRQGVKTVETVLKACKELGIKILTLYVFSTENWKRPKKEVSALMRLMEEYLDRELEKLQKEGVRLHVMGRIDRFPPSLQLKLRKAETSTRNNKAIILNLAIGYGARTEIVDACRNITNDVLANRLKPAQIDEKVFSDNLYTKGLQDPDLLIRTSGEMRVSNFLLWQISYAEIYVTNTFWPDFRKRDLEKAILAYQKRERRFGA